MNGSDDSEDEYIATEDAEPVSGKTYYTRSGEGTDASPYVYTEFEGNEFVSGTTYYELVESGT